MKIKGKKTEDRYLRFALKLHARKRGFKSLAKLLLNDRISSTLGKIMRDDGLVVKRNGIWRWNVGKPTSDMAKRLQVKINNRLKTYAKAKKSGKTERTFLDNYLFRSKSTLRDMAKATGISYPVLIDIKHGRVGKYRQRTLIDVANYCRCTVYDLMRRIDGPKHEQKEKMENASKPSDILNLADLREERSRILNRMEKIDAVLKAASEI